MNSGGNLNLLLTYCFNLFYYHLFYRAIKYLWKTHKQNHLTTWSLIMIRCLRHHHQRRSQNQIPLGRKCICNWGYHHEDSELPLCNFFDYQFQSNSKNGNTWKGKMYEFQGTSAKACAFKYAVFDIFDVKHNPKRLWEARHHFHPGLITEYPLRSCWLRI